MFSSKHTMILLNITDNIWYIYTCNWVLNHGHHNNGNEQADNHHPVFTRARLQRGHDAHVSRFVVNAHVDAFDVVRQDTDNTCSIRVPIIFMKYLNPFPQRLTVLLIHLVANAQRQMLLPRNGFRQCVQPLVLFLEHTFLMPPKIVHIRLLQLTGAAALNWCAERFIIVVIAVIRP